MKNLILIVIAAGIFIVGLFAAYNLGSNKQNKAPIPEISVTPTEPVVGGDRDAHGCIGSAGYSWCEPKSKCLRIWEEKCYESLKKEIEAILTRKYNKSVDEVKVTITKQNDLYAGGSVLFGEGGPGEAGMFLARKTGDIWEVVFDGNGNVDCTKMRQDYGFTDDILKPNFCD